MSRNHIFLVVLLTTTFLTLSLISAYHNDMFSHLENTTAPLASLLENTTAPLAPPVAPPLARPLGSALSRHLDNSDNTTASSPLARPLGSALSALSRHLDNTAARSSQSYLGTAVTVTILSVGVLILAYFLALVLFGSPPAEAVEEKVEGESKLPEKEEEKEKEEKEKEEKEEEVHHDEAFWKDVLAKDGRGKAKAVKAKQREEQTNRKRSIKWHSSRK